jgi:hypothetical protein
MSGFVNSIPIYYPLLKGKVDEGACKMGLDVKCSDFQKHHSTVLLYICNEVSSVYCVAANSYRNVKQFIQNESMRTF